jgi:MoaA/NifB/PqqE/SkfB family radical SAM enzyme
MGALGLLKKRSVLFSKIMEYKLTKKRTPIIAYLLITDRCNLRCRYCFVDCDQKKDRELNTQEWLSLIDEMYDMGVRMICLMGGEPLLYQDIDEIIKYIHAKGIICDLTTNGLLVQKKIEAIKYLDSLMISLDGDELANDTNRGKGVYKRVLQAIQTACENGVIIRINCVLTKQNKDSFEHILDLCDEYGLYATFSITAEFPQEHIEDAHNIILNDDEIKNIYIQLKSLRKQGRRILFSEGTIDYVINYPLPYNKIIFADDQENLNYYKSSCLFGRTMFYVDSNGMIYPCAALWNSSGYKPKSVLDVGFKNAWENMSTLPCVTCFCPGVPEWNYVTSIQGVLHGLGVSLSQLISRKRNTKQCVKQSS